MLGTSPEKDKAILSALIGTDINPQPTDPASKRLRYRARHIASTRDRLIFSLRYDYHVDADVYVAGISGAFDGKYGCIRLQDIEEVLGAAMEVRRPKGSHMPLVAREYIYMGAGLQLVFRFLARECASSFDGNRTEKLDGG